MIGFSAVLPAFAAVPPVAYGPTPSARQLQWHDLELYGFVHFTVNTFTDKDWGYGDEDPSVFNPTNFDANQIAAAAKAGGLAGIIITAKHHDGFCLWPSKFTEHSIKNSPWKNGKGDMVKEFSAACQKQGIKFGVYLSPWDRNHADYGKPEYLTYFRNQLRELLTQYGPVFEIWFDGANGGDGFYGGAKERRTIDQRHYYDWENTFQLIRELQPDACVWGNAGPDIRWIGNERAQTAGHAWATLNLEKNPDDFVAGQLNYYRLATGDRHGTHWIPAEVDFSICPSWFYHNREAGRAKTGVQLADIYFRTVGRGAAMLMNIAPDQRGLIPDDQVKGLQEFKAILDATFAQNLAKEAKVTASNIRGDDPQFAAANLVDGNRQSYWSSDDAVVTPELLFEFDHPATFNTVDVREFLPLGERVDGFSIDALVNGEWKQLAAGTGIGTRRLERIGTTTTTKVRLRFTQSPVCPAIAEFGLYLEPEASRAHANKPVSTQIETGMPRDGWKVFSASSGTTGNEAAKAIDGDSKTYWAADQTAPQEFIVDMGTERTLGGFLYLPRQDDRTGGNVDQYAFYVNNDPGSKRGLAAVGEFANIDGTPIQQKVTFQYPVKGRYFRFVALHSTPGEKLSVADLGVCTVESLPIP